MAVAPRPVKYGSALLNGTKFAQFTTIIRAQHVYDQSPPVGDPKQYTLKEIRYRVRCPKCGEREVVEGRTKGRKCSG